MSLTLQLLVGLLLGTVYMWLLILCLVASNFPACHLLGMTCPRFLLIYKVVINLCYVADDD